MSNDTLSEVLRAVRLTGAVFFAIDATSPWAAEAPVAGEIGPYVLPGIEHVIEFHVIASGECWGGALDEPVRKLSAGDVILFPQGDAHVLSSDPGLRSPPDRGLVQRALSGRLPLAVSLDGGGRERAEVICGFLGCDARPFNPLLSSLPRTIHVAHQDSDNGLIEPFVKFALSESSSPRPGGDCVLARLAELLFVDIGGGTSRRSPRIIEDGCRACAMRPSGAPSRGCTRAPRTTGASKIWRARSGCRARCWPSGSRSSWVFLRCSTSPIGACSSRPTCSRARPSGSRRSPSAWATARRPR